MMMLLMSSRLRTRQAADVIELASLRIKTAARVGIIIAELGENLRHVHAVREQLVGVEQHLVLHGGAAEAGIVRHARNGAVVALEHPILQDFEFLGRTVGTLQDVAVDEAAGAVQRREARHQSGGHLRVGHALEGLLADEVGVRSILEIHGHE
jgi:hypothetical protein